MKRSHWLRTVLSLVALLAISTTAAQGALVVIDDFGAPDQSIEISPGVNVRVSSPFAPMFGFGPLASNPLNPSAQGSGSYAGSLTGDPFTPGSLTYDGTSSTYYSYASYGTLSGGIISSDPGGGTRDFSQRDVLLVVDPLSSGGQITYSANGVVNELSGGGGIGSTLLLQYDGVDSEANVDGNVTGDDGLGLGGTYSGSAFTNAQGLSDGVLVGGGGGHDGYDLLAGGNHSFYFNGMVVDANVSSVLASPGVLVTIKVWTVDGGSTPHVASAIFADTNGLAVNYFIPFSAFGGAGVVAEFDQVTGIDVLFELQQNEDIMIGTGPGGGLTAQTPEPATLAIWSMLGLGSVGLGYFRRRKLAA